MIKSCRFTDPAMVATIMIGILAPLAKAQENLPVPIKGQAPTSSEVLVEKIREAIVQGDTEAAADFTRELSRQGDDALAAIKADLKKQDEERTMLFFALGLIPTAASTNILLERAALDGNGPPLSVSGLGGRVVKRSLSSEEMEQWLFRIRHGKIGESKIAVGLLSTAQFNDADVRVKAILDRLVAELLIPTIPGTDTVEAEDVRAENLGVFVRAFGNFKQPEVVVLLRRMVQEQKDPLVVSWLSLALGFAQDSNVAEKLKDVVNQAQTPTMKVLALRAYCRSAKLEAIPFLKTILAAQIEKLGIENVGPGSRDIVTIAISDEFGQIKKLRQRLEQTEKKPVQN